MNLFPVVLIARCSAIQIDVEAFLIHFIRHHGIPHRPFFWPPRFPPPPPPFPPPPRFPPPPPLALPPPPPPLPRPPTGFWFPLTLACPRSLDATAFLPGSYPPNALLRPP